MTPLRYHNFTLYELGRSNISLTGDSGFGIRTAFDIDQTEPTWASYDSATLIRYNSADNGTYKPFIEISYTYIPVVTGISPSIGPEAGGTSVIITGTNLTGVTAVAFGVTAATDFSFVNDTSITATSPAGTGTVDVTVTTDGGTSVTGSADEFTYIVAPTVTGISPSIGPEAGGTSVNITGTNLTGVTAVAFGVTAATDFSFVNDTSITATSPAGTGTVDVTVTTVGGTSATGSADEFTYAAVPSAAPFGVGVFRPSNHIFYLKNGTTTTINWGISTDLPVTGDWNGDGRTDVGVFRPSNHMFYLKNGTTTTINWGTSTDKPVTGKWG
jgi:hypothetical protein